MTDFTKIKWAGEDCILITTSENHNARLPILILTKYDIEKIIKEWKKELHFLSDDKTCTKNGVKELGK